MFDGVRSETTVSTSLVNIHLWLAQNQGTEVDVIDLPLQVGLPIAAARAVICSVWLLDEGPDSTPLLAGRLRGLLNPRDGSVRPAFDGRAAPALAGGKSATTESVRAEGAPLARHLLESLAVDCERAGELLAA